MELCYKMKKIKFLFVFLFVFILLFQIVSAELNYANMNLIENEGVSIYTSTGDGKVSLDVDGKIRHYWDLAKDSFIEYSGSSISAADLTALKETTWVINDKQIKVPAGGRVVYKNGEIEIYGEEQVFGIGDASSEQGALKNLKLGEKPVKIKDGWISGNWFYIDNVLIWNGNIQILDNGYLLGKSSAAIWNGFTLFSRKDLLLAKDEKLLNNYENWIFPEEQRLRAKGNDFSVDFNKNNKYAKIDSDSDLFKIEMKDSFFDLANRDNLKLIPKLDIGGEFSIDEDSKSIYTSSGKILIKKGYISSKETSPVEIVVEGSDKKFIVNNFNGIATVGKDETIGISDEKYSDSIYFQRASIENRYNYPTKDDFKDITGKKLDFYGGSGLFSQKEPDPKTMGKLIDFYETLPDKDKKALQAIYLYYSVGDIIRNTEFDEACGKSAGACYRQDEGVIYFQANSPNSDIESFRHEVSHLHHDTLFVEDKFPDFFKNKQLNLEEYDKLRDTLAKSLNKDPKESFTYDPEKLSPEQAEIIKKIDDIIALNFPVLNKKNKFNQKWIEVAGGEKEYNSYLDLESQKKGEFKWKGSGLRESRYGFVKPYGGSSYKEDVATFAEMVLGNPKYFKDNGLITEGSSHYDPRYSKKIALLKQEGFISQAECNAVFSPNKCP